MIKQDLIVLLVIVMLVVASCGGEAPSATKTKAPQTVRLIAAEEGRLPRTVTLTGTLAAGQEVIAGFKVAGRVSEMMVDLGSSVRKGEVLARLDPIDFRLRVEQAGAALRQARARLGLSPEGEEEQVDPEKTATVREARALLDEARLNRERMEQLKESALIPQSDFDAAIAKFLVAGAPVVTLVQLHPLRMKAAVPERDAPAIRVGQTVKVQIEGDDAERQGRLARVSPVIEEKTRTLAIEAEVDNQEGRIRPGSFARAEILVAEQSFLAPYLLAGDGIPEGEGGIEQSACGPIAPEDSAPSRRTTVQ